MNLYLISQRVNKGYDTYDSAVVAAPTEAFARLTHPSQYACGGWGPVKVNGPDVWRGQYANPAHPSCGQFYELGGGDWADPGYVDVALIGTATEGTEPGVICASFNAG